MTTTTTTTSTTTTPEPGDGLAAMLDTIDVVDPYPLWQALLDGEPLCTPDGSFALLTRHADCDAQLRSATASVDRANSARWQELSEQMTDEERERMARGKVFLFMDDPDHSRLRRLVSKAFTPRTVEGLRPLVERLSRELLDAAVARGRIELVDDLAYPLPVRVISEMLGVPAEDHARFAGWSEVLAQGLDDSLGTNRDDDVLRLRRESSDAFREYFLDLCEQRRQDPQDDLLTRLVQAEDEGDRLTGDELVSTAMLLLIAGHETTVSLISNGALALLRDPDLRRQVAEDPARAGGLVEEVLRLDPPVQMTMRTALVDTPVPGGTVKRGGTMVLLLAAAGRDPEQHADPLRWDLDRTTPHLALSAGPHYCLGAPLARLEGTVVLADLARRLVDPTLGTLTYRENRVLRGPAVLEIGYEAVVD